MKQFWIDVGVKSACSDSHAENVAFLQALTERNILSVDSERVKKLSNLLERLDRFFPDDRVITGHNHFKRGQKDLTILVDN